MKLLPTELLMALSLVSLLGCQTAGSATVPARMGADRITDACIVQMQNFITSRQGPRTAQSAPLLPTLPLPCHALTRTRTPLLSRT